MATLNVRGCRKKKTDIQATATMPRVDVLAITETRSRFQGRVEGGHHDLWGLRAGILKGKALLVHT